MLACFTNSLSILRINVWEIVKSQEFFTRFLPTPHMALQEETVLGHFSCCRHHITIFSFNMIWSHCKRLTLRNKNGNYINPKKTYKYFINRSTKITCLEKLYSWFAFTKVHFMVTNNIELHHLISDASQELNSTEIGSLAHCVNTNLFAHLH